MAVVSDYSFEPMVGDPDDHRPGSEWALVVDPETKAGDYVQGLTLLFEHVGVGEAIPLHTHPMDEVIVIDRGDGEVVVGDERRAVTRGATVFIPAGKPHGTRNAGSGTLDLHAVFPAPSIGISYLARNPAPGTDGAAPQPPFVFEVRQR